MPSKQRQSMLEKKDKLSLTRQCELLVLNRNSFYYSPKGECEQNLKIMTLLQEQYLKTPFYGYRKIEVWLEKQGFIVKFHNIIDVVDYI